jgi:hypothetical protein
MFLLLLSLLSNDEEKEDEEDEGIATTSGRGLFFPNSRREVKRKTSDGY